jgi:hypothetical protein
VQSVLCGAGTSVAKPYIMGKAARRDDQPENLTDMLPSWVGYTGLYGISAIPVIIGVSVLGVLVANLLR